MHMIVVGTPLNHRKQERARAQCLEYLILELADLGVSRVYLEQRHKTLNAADMVTVSRMHGRRIIPNTMRVEPQQPSEEPMLWVPDVLCGAYADALRGGSTPFELLEPKTTVLTLPLR